MPTQASVGFVTHDFFDVLGVQPSLGRDFIADDDSRGARPVALLTHRFWRRSFNGDASVIGRALSVSGSPAVVVGVLPRAFRAMTLTENPDVYLAFHTLAAWESGMSPEGKILVDGQPRQFPSMVSYVQRRPSFLPDDGDPASEGRSFGVDEPPGTSPPVAIVSESFARLLAEGRACSGVRVGGIGRRHTRGDHRRRVGRDHECERV